MTHILVVDDDPDVAESIQIMLEDRDYSFETARNGREGMRALGSGDFDLIITDVLMPEKDGLELVMEAKKNFDIKIIAMSGGGRGSAKNYLEMASDFGADAILAKPFSINQLLDCIDQVMR